MRVIVEAVRNDFPKVADRLSRGTFDIVSEITANIEAGYRADVHIESGQLAGSIDSEVTQVRGVVTGWVGATAEHAPYEEYGTGSRGAASSFPGKPEGIPYSGSWIGRPAHPALTPHVETGRADMQREFANLERRLR